MATSAYQLLLHTEYGHLRRQAFPIETPRTVFMLSKSLIMCNCRIPGKVQFEVRAEGGEDEGGMGVSSIKINGVEHCPKKVGHNVVVLDPIGEVVAAKNFNTNSGEGPAMKQFLDQLPEDHVVLVASQGVSGREQGMYVHWFLA